MNKNEMFPKGFFSKKRQEEKKYIELIDKYEIRQSESDDYNPPSYIWTDNTGELIRCKDCKYWESDNDESFCSDWGAYGTGAESYCSFAKRKEE